MRRGGLKRIPSPCASCASISPDGGRAPPTYTFSACAPSAESRKYDSNCRFPQLTNPTLFSVTPPAPPPDSIAPPSISLCRPLSLISPYRHTLRVCLGKLSSLPGALTYCFVISVGRRARGHGPEVSHFPLPRMDLGQRRRPSWMDDPAWHRGCGVTARRGGLEGVENPKPENAPELTYRNVFSGPGERGSPVCP